MTAIFADGVTNALVIAPPGCGKTELLAQTTREIIPTLQPNQRILALTFSNKARDNLETRIRTVLGPATFRRYIKMRNFHGHAAELLSAHAPTIGLSRDFTAPTPRQYEQAINARFGNLHTRQRAPRESAMLEALGNAKREPRTDDEVMAELVRTGNPDAIAVQQSWFSNKVLHYDDLLRHVQRLLHIDSVANLYQHHYGAVLVDEYQDLSPQQLDIALRTVTQRRLFAGDPLQGIYSWTGARPVEVGKSLHALCGNPTTLTTSYRSAPNVLTVVNAASAALAGPALHAADPAQWPGGGCSGAVTFQSGADEASWIQRQCRLILHRDPQASIGVIARSRWRRKPIDAAFAAGTVTYSRWDNALDDPHVLAVLRTAWQSLPAKADFAALEDAALTMLSDDETATFADLTDALAELEQQAAGSSMATALSRALARTSTFAVTGPGIHLLNAHVGKGQQFDWVFVPGIEDFHLPSGQASTPAEKQEEDRVLLVILSRARHGLILSRAETLISNAGKPYDTEESKYWANLVAGAQLNQAGIENHIATYHRR